jgi:hypothetical protein
MILVNKDPSRNNSHNNHKQVSNEEIYWLSYSSSQPSFSEWILQPCWVGWQTSLLCFQRIHWSKHTRTWTACLHTTLTEPKGDEKWDCCCGPVWWMLLLAVRNPNYLLIGLQVVDIQRLHLCQWTLIECADGVQVHVDQMDRSSLMSKNITGGTKARH